MKKSSIPLIIVLLLVVAIVVWLGFHFGRNDKVLLQGYVECRSLRASSKLAGRIARMYVEEGDRVKKGDTLYMISTPELDAKLVQVEALLSGARAIEERAKVGARKQVVNSARDMWRKAEAGLRLAQQTYERVARLYDEGVVTAQKRDEAYASLESMRATMRAARSQYLLAVEGASREDKEAAAAQVEQAQGAVEEVERYLADRVVYAPVDGEVSTIVAYTGELVGSGATVVTIVEDGSAKAVFNVAETLLPQIAYGERFEARVPALDQRVGFEVAYISVEAAYATQSATSARGDFDIRTFEVKMLPLGEVALKEGMSLIIELQKPSAR